MYPKYQITYWNGMIQKKNLIPHSDYTGIIVPKLIEAHEAECRNDKKTSERLKSEVKKQFGDYFTDQSPLFDSIQTGVLILPASQGGNHNVNIIKL